MDIVIHTSDPDGIDMAEIKVAVEGLGYYVNSVQVEERGL